MNINVDSVRELAWLKDSSKRPADFTGFPDLKKAAVGRRGGFTVNEFEGDLGRKLDGLDWAQMKTVFFWGEDVGWSMYNLHESTYGRTVHISVIFRAFQAHIRFMGGLDADYAYRWVRNTYIDAKNRGEAPIIALENAIRELEVRIVFEENRKRIEAKYRTSFVPVTISRPQQFGQWA